MLEARAEGLWTVTQPLRFLGLEVGTRMTIVRLQGGGLFVHSPVAIDASLQREVDALGDVAAIVAPNLFHHLYAADWAKAYPKALLCACPGLERKRRDVAWSRVLGDAPSTEWQGSLRQLQFGALPMLNELVFFHEASRTLIASDLVMNLASHASSLTRAVAFCVGHRAPGPTILERILIKDRKAARAQIDQMLDWDAERIVLAHGDIVASNGRAALAAGYDWL